MKNRKNPYADLLLWTGVGALALLYLNRKEETHAQSNENDSLVRENLKYNQIFSKTEFGGNPYATNKKGSGKFNYLGFLQAKHAFGLECYAASVVNIFKSLGIIEPNMGRKEFELTYTNLHLASDAPESFKKLVKKSGYRIEEYFNDSLRGMYDLGIGQEQLSPENFAEISIKKEEIETYLLAGYIVRIYTDKEGHYTVATSIKKIPLKNGKSIKIVLTDDTWYGANTAYQMKYVHEPWIIKAV